MLTIYRAEALAYDLLNVLLDGRQGALVAVVICYSNGRVVEELGRKWASSRAAARLRRESMHRLRSHGVASVAAPSGASDWPSSAGPPRPKSSAPPSSPPPSQSPSPPPPLSPVNHTTNL